MLNGTIRLKPSCCFVLVPALLQVQIGDEELGQEEQNLHSSEYGEVCKWYIVSVLGRDMGYTIKYSPSPEGVPEDET